jgi:hypothetical protein
MGYDLRPRHVGLMFGKTERKCKYREVNLKFEKIMTCSFYSVIQGIYRF